MKARALTTNALKTSLLFVCLLLAHSSAAALIQITYEATFNNTSDVPIFDAFGVTQVSVTLTIDTSQPIVVVPAGSTTSYGPGDTWAHALYGYSSEALSFASFTFGNGTWSEDNEIVAQLSPDYAAAAIWFDQPLSSDGSARLLTGFDNDGDLYLFGTFSCIADGSCAFNDNYVTAFDVSENYFIDASSVNVDFRAVPIPAALWMFSAAIGLYLRPST